MHPLLYLPLQILAVLDSVSLLEGVRLVVAGFALVLLVISLTAYRRNSSTRLLFVSGAFSVVLVRVLLVENLPLMFPSLSLDITDLLRGALDLVTLLLFFLAVVRN
ncbi:MAG: hypothetical protein JRN06_03185 [Nitrososphaerota archaeon]|nr:hypothetical protein [Nitrososphaerota archaeon]MDG7023138.1 hypothetical protein [Nitrososphaerota archaeon]